MAKKAKEKQARKPEVRQAMIAAAAVSLAKRGLANTSFSEILEASGAPRGSLYHPFPGGKDELVSEAIAFASARMLQLLESRRGESARSVAEAFLDLWRAVLSRGKQQAGCAIAAVTVAGEGPLLARTAELFRFWRATLAELLEQGGLKKKEAARMSALLVSASEGAVLLARAERSMEPFELACEALLAQL